MKPNNEHVVTFFEAFHGIIEKQKDTLKALKAVLAIRKSQPLTEEQQLLVDRTLDSLIDGDYQILLSLDEVLRKIDPKRMN